MRKRLYALITVIALLLNCTLTAGASVRAEEQTPNSNAEYLEVQNASIALYNEILDSFDSQTMVASMEGASTEEKYPEYYGGAYIDTVTGELVLLVTDERSETLMTRSVDVTDAAFRYEQCDVSLNEINEAIYLINNQLEELRNEGVFITMVCDDILNQRVLVSVQDLTEAKKQEVLEIADYAFIEFEEAEPVVRETELGGGWPVSSTGGSGTLGFPATRNGVTGFVTAGHGSPGTGGVFKYTNPYTGTTSTVGSVTANAFTNGSSADALFIKAASGITTTTELHFGGTLFGASTASLPVNTLVYKYGSATGLTSGYVQNTNATVIDGDGIKTTGCYVTNYESESGDSGGPVLVYAGYSLGETLYTLYGIHVGASGSNSFYSPYTNIVSKLGVTCITS